MSELKPERYGGGPAIGTIPQWPQAPTTAALWGCISGIAGCIPFCIASCPNFPSTSLRDPIISINQPPNVASWLLSKTPQLRTVPTSRDSGTRTFALNASQLPSRGIPVGPLNNCRDMGPKLRRKSLALRLLSALSSGQWTPLRPVDIKRPMVESGADDMDAVDDVRTSRLFGPPVSDRVLLLARLP